MRKPKNRKKKPKIKNKKENLEIGKLVLEITKILLEILKKKWKQKADNWHLSAFYLSKPKIKNFSYKSSYYL